MRLFVAALLSPDAVEDLEHFLEPRRSVAGAPHWSDPGQWHLTLTFMGSVSPSRVDDLSERLAVRSRRWPLLSLQVRGGGAFPDVGSATVLYAGVHSPPAEGTWKGDGEDGDGSSGLASLARSVRNTCSAAGAQPDGRRFRPHLTLGRFRPPVEASRWVRVLDTYAGPTVPLAEVALVESHLGQGRGGRPRHVVVDTFALGVDTP